MLEAQAHHQIKTLLRQEESDWPHHLTLSRLVAQKPEASRHNTRSAPPQQQRTLVARSAGAAVPGSRSGGAGADGPPAPASAPAGIAPSPQPGPDGSPAGKGPTPPEGPQLWLMDVGRADSGPSRRALGPTRQLLIPEMDQLSRRMRNALTFEITPHHWDELRQACPQAEAGLMELHDRMSRQLFAGATRPGGARCDSRAQQRKRCVTSSS